MADKEEREEEEEEKPALPWGLEKEKLQTSSKVGLTTNKIKGFTLGTHTKSRFQKHKEEIEAKRKKEEEEAAKVFEDFVASFEGDNRGGGRGISQPGAFVRGDVVNDTKGSNASQGSSGGEDSRESKVYMLRHDPPPRSSPRAIPQKDQPMIPPVISLDTEENREVRKRSAKGSKRGIDALMEDLKSGGADTRGGSGRGGGDRDRDRDKHRKMDDDRAKYERLMTVEDLGLGSFDQGDPDTTNLYVGNLHPSVTEEVLCREFGVYGPIASVKIMWPRTPEEKSRGRNCGFVNMWNRRDAEKAREEKAEEVLLGLEMKVGWGKALPRPDAPVYVHSKVETPHEAPGRAREVRVACPRDPDVKRMIDKLATYVAREGPDFERAIILRESDNSDFDFLWEPNSREGIYYKWKVYTLCQSDSEFEWRRSSFQMFVGGLTWFPPEEDSVQDSRPHDGPRKRSRSRSRGQSRSPPRGRGKGDKKRNHLTERERDEFEDLLRLLTSERDAIGDAMVFCLSRAECAKEIVETITEALCISETPIPTKISRLYLVSDILHNTSANIARASLFRSLFEATMPEIFESFGDRLRNTEGRITAEAMREKVTRVLRVWEVWSLYPPQLIARLEATFLGKEVVEYAMADDAVVVGGDAASMDGEPVSEEEELDGVPMDDDDVDGEPFDEDDFPLGSGMAAAAAAAHAEAAERQAARATTRGKGEEEEEEEDYDPSLPISKWNHPRGWVEGA